MKNIPKVLISRRFLLLLADIAIVIAVYGFVCVLSKISISSLILANGPFSPSKLIAMYLPVFLIRILMGLYNYVWKYANVSTYMKVVIADCTGSAAFFLAGRYWFRQVYIGFSYTVIMLMMVLLATLMSRFLFQLMAQSGGRLSVHGLVRSFLRKDAAADIHRINVAIVGAGTLGVQLAEELLHTQNGRYYPYCFIDKTKDKVDYSINGIHIYSEDDHILEVLEKLPIHEIIIAVPDTTKENKERLYSLYSQTGCRVKTYDYPLEATKDEEERPVIRDFSVEELLFRNTINVNSSRAKAFYAGKKILVTGGGGSIGSEICRQLARLSVKQLIILDIYENTTYELQQELMALYGDSLNLVTEIASVRDMARMEEIFQKYRPEVVFHAAAHKHVPLMEFSGSEAIKNNVFGTKNVADLSDKYGVERFLLISTDKAVNPTNIMGASKRLCEMVVLSKNQTSKTCFTAVRFGNVLGSNGSVIPLFKKQIEKGGPITITDKRIIRYFMTIPEAVGLVMEANAMAKSGELYVLDMGNPVKILDLAEKMITLSGYKPYEDIDIIEVGLRPGEKLYEELLMNDEKLSKTDNKMIFIEKDEPLSEDVLAEKLKLLEAALVSSEHDNIVDVIKKTVPTYTDPGLINAQV